TQPQARRPHRPNHTEADHDRRTRRRHHLGDIHDHDGGGHPVVADHQATWRLPGGARAGEAVGGAAGRGRAGAAGTRGRVAAARAAGGAGGVRREAADRGGRRCGGGLRWAPWGWAGRGSSRRRGAPVLTLAVVIAACGNTGIEREWAVTVDTLPYGAVHVVNVPPTVPTLTWTIEEELRIGAIDGDGPATFGQLKGLAVTADGRIAVLDAQAKELKIFGPDGAHLATYGRKGGGPGEFEEPYGLMMGPDGRLYVPDHRNARVSVFDVDTGFVESHAFRVRSWGFVWDGAMGADGRIFEPSITFDEQRRP